MGEAGRKGESGLEAGGEVRWIRLETNFPEGEKKDFSKRGDHVGGRGFGPRDVGYFIGKGESGEADSGQGSPRAGPIGKRGDFGRAFHFDRPTEVGLGGGGGVGDRFDCTGRTSEKAFGSGRRGKGEVSASTDGVVGTEIGAIAGAVADVSGNLAGAEHSGGRAIGLGEDVRRVGGVGFLGRRTKAWRVV